MNFEEQLQAKRSALRPTETIIKVPSGEVFLESRLGNNVNLIKLDTYSPGYVVDTKPDTVAVEILNSFLYLGSQDAVNRNNIRTYGITHILSVGIETPLSQTNEVLVEHKLVPCLDLPETDLFDSNKIIEEACRFIETCRHQNGRVLVHCNAGVSRSATCVIAYLMKHHGLVFDEALKLVRAKRPCIQPNIGFIKQLKMWKP